MRIRGAASFLVSNIPIGDREHSSSGNQRGFTYRSVVVGGLNNDRTTQRFVPTQDTLCFHTSNTFFAVCQYFCRVLIFLHSANRCFAMCPRIGTRKVGAHSKLTVSGSVCTAHCFLSLLYLAPVGDSLKGNEGESGPVSITRMQCDNVTSGPRC